MDVHDGRRNDLEPREQMLAVRLGVQERGPVDRRGAVSEATLRRRRADQVAR